MILYAGGAEWGSMCHYPRTLLSRARVHVVTKWREDSGAELLEAALVIPIMLMLLLGIISFGRAWNVYQTITRAAREGAREAVLTPCATCSGPNYNASGIWTNFVNPVLQSDNLDPTNKVYVASQTMEYINLDVPPGTTPTGCTSTGNCVCGILVQFTYPYTLSLPFTSVNLSTLNLTTHVQMRLESPPTDQSSCTGPVP